MRSKGPPVLINCSACKGSGRVELHPAYADALDVITHDWKGTLDIAKRLPKVNRTAVNNRLTWLERVGLIKSQKSSFGKSQRMWRRL